MGRNQGPGSHERLRSRTRPEIPPPGGSATIAVLALALGLGVVTSVVVHQFLLILLYLGASSGSSWIDPLRDPVTGADLGFVQLWCAVTLGVAGLFLDRSRSGRCMLLCTLAAAGVPAASALVALSRHRLDATHGAACVGDALLAIPFGFVCGFVLQNARRWHDDFVNLMLPTGAAVGVALRSVRRRCLDLLRALGRHIDHKVRRMDRLDPQALVRMTGQLGIMMRAGIGLLRSIAALEQQEINVPLKSALEHTGNELFKGRTLSEALAQRPAVFNEFYVGMVRVGEATGRLDAMLLTLAAYLEQDLNLVRRARAAMTYPMLVLAVAAVIVWGIFVYIIPSLLATFVSLAPPGFTMPLPTRALQFTVYLCTNPWVQFGCILAVFFFGFFYHEYRATPRGRYVIDHMRLDMPAFGLLNRQVQLARLFRGLGTMLEQGVPITHAMDTLLVSTENSYFTFTTLVPLAKRVTNGDMLSSIFREDPAFPTIAANMVAVGEESGTVADMLIRLSIIYDQQVTQALDAMLTVLEPILICAMGLLVAFVLLAVFLPLYGVVMSLR